MRASALTFSVLLGLILTCAPPQANAAVYRAGTAGTTAIVVGVDHPEGCLRIRNRPSTASAIIGCVERGQAVRLTGTWAGPNWAEIRTPIIGWVYAPQIRPSNVPVTVRRAVAAPVTVYANPYPFKRFWRKHWRKQWRKGWRKGWHPRAAPYFRRGPGRGVVVRAGRKGVVVHAGRGFRGPGRRWRR